MSRDQIQTYKGAALRYVGVFFEGILLGTEGREEFMSWTIPMCGTVCIACVRRKEYLSRGPLNVLLPRIGPEPCYCLLEYSPGLSV